MGQLERLQSDLIEFGLNPEEWELSVRGRFEENVWIEVKSGDEDLTFAGIAKDGRWQNLELV